MTEIQSLFKLQELDMECLALETALRELPVQKEIDESQERLSMLRERLSRLGLELNRVRKEQKHEEWEIKDITATASSISRKLYGGEVTNPREIENMRYRLDTLEATKSRLEDDVIALMEQAEALESEISEVNLEITQKEAELVELTGKRDLEMAAVSAKLSDITEDRERLRTQIPDPLVKKYEQLLRDRGGSVVVPIKGKICGGCHVTLPSSIVILAKPNNAVVRCENCGRILCWRE
jgi:predicted  nucleic acid-binding Zn-ribbon protein